MRAGGLGSGECACMVSRKRKEEGDGGGPRMRGGMPPRDHAHESAHDTYTPSHAHPQSRSAGDLWASLDGLVQSHIASYVCVCPLSKHLRHVCSHSTTRMRIVHHTPEQHGVCYAEGVVVGDVYATYEALASLLKRHFNMTEVIVEDDRALCALYHALEGLRGSVRGVGTGSKEMSSEAGMQNTGSVASACTVTPTRVSGGMAVPICSVSGMNNGVGPRIENLHVTYRVREFDDGLLGRMMDGGLLPHVKSLRVSRLSQRGFSSIVAALGRGCCPDLVSLCLDEYDVCVEDADALACALEGRLYMCSTEIDRHGIDRAAYAESTAVCEGLRHLSLTCWDAGMRRPIARVLAACGDTIESLCIKLWGAGGVESMAAVATHVSSCRDRCGGAVGLKVLEMTAYGANWRVLERALCRGPAIGRVVSATMKGG